MSHPDRILPLTGSNTDAGGIMINLAAAAAAAATVSLLCTCDVTIT